MKKKHFQPLLLFILIATIAVISLTRSGNPCARQVSYKNIYVNNGINWDSLFAEPTSVELENTLQDWKKRPLAPKNVEIIKEYKFFYKNYLRLVRHYVGERKHYGAIFLPEGYDQAPPGSLPVLIFAYGLDQQHPVVQVDGWAAEQLFQELDSHYIVVVPSYRGQSLLANSKFYCSDGFFGDAFDGATDDALALLNVTLSSVPAADTTRIAAMGVSRGGTVALLAGVRDRRIQLVVDQSGPTNFLSRRAHSRYFKQYKYQFLNVKKPIPALRKRILASSPYYFTEYLPDVVITHGAKDRVVPLEQAQIVVDRLEDKGFRGQLIVDIKTEGGHNLGGFGENLKRLNDFARE